MVGGRRARDSGGELSPTSVSAYKCGKTFVWGGVCQFGRGAGASSTFSVAKRHNSIRLKVAVAFLDYWFNNAEFVVRVDGQLVWSVNPSLLPRAGWICGCCWDVGMVVANIEVVHSSDEATVELGSTMSTNSCDDSWGLVGVEVEGL